MTIETDPLIGLQISNHEIVARLGQGGMGVVYRARHLTLERDVAIKFLASHLATNPSYVERFIREARAAARLNHANLIAVHDAGVQDDAYYIVMEYVEGQDLSKRLREQTRFSEKETIRFGIKTAGALAYAHQQGIVHRDIKPENLIVTAEGELKIADLGLAKQMNDENSSMTMSGTVVGTPYYISPEQIRGSRHVDHRTDIYSLGVSLFHLATGQVPFHGGSSAEIMARHLTEQPLMARSINPELSEAFSQVIFRSMAKKPEDRYSTMDDVCHALEALQKDSTAMDASPKRILRVPSLDPASAPVRPSPTPTPPPSPIATVPVPSRPPPSGGIADGQKLRLRDSTAPSYNSSRNPLPFPLWKIIVAAVFLLLVGAGFYFYPKFRQNVNLAKNQVFSTVNDTTSLFKKLQETDALESLIRQRIANKLENLASKAGVEPVEGIVTYTLHLDSSGRIVELKTSSSSSSSLESFTRKAIQKAAPYESPHQLKGTSPFPWQGRLEISAKISRIEIQRPLKAHEKNLKRNLLLTLSRISQQKIAIETQIAQARSSPSPKPPPPSHSSLSIGGESPPFAPPPGNGSGTKIGFGTTGDSDLSLSEKVSSAVDPERIAKLESQLQTLHQQESQIRTQLAPLDSDKIAETVDRSTFAVRVQSLPSAS